MNSRIVSTSRSSNNSRNDHREWPVVEAEVDIDAERVGPAGKADEVIVVVGRPYPLVSRAAALFERREVSDDQVLVAPEGTRLRASVTVIVGNGGEVIHEYLPVPVDKQRLTERSGVECPSRERRR